jgi:hypothetical protein
VVSGFCHYRVRVVFFTDEPLFKAISLFLISLFTIVYTLIVPQSKKKGVGDLRKKVEIPPLKLSQNLKKYRPG